MSPHTDTPNLWIRGGTVVTPGAAIRADVLVDDGRISYVGHRPPDTAGRVQIDATGRAVLPGAVDVHTHMATRDGDEMIADDFTTGTLAAAAGGTTTIVNFAFPERGEKPLETIARWRSLIEAAELTGWVGLHYTLHSDPPPATLAELDQLPGVGVPSIKCFTAYRNDKMLDDRTLYRVMRIAARTGSTVLVHAENGDVIDVLVEEALAGGHVGPRFHARTRPREQEAEATHRVTVLAGLAGCELYVVHVSCAEALEHVAAARRSGAAVTAEVLAHHLVFDESQLDAPDFEGAKWVFSPPPRTEPDRRALWNGLVEDVASVVSSDHGPWNFAGAKTRGREDFTRIANGASGVEERASVLLDLALARGMPLTRAVDLLCSRPADLFGFGADKGRIVVGADADLVVWDLETPRTISIDTQHSPVDYTPYEGHTVRATAETVVITGQVVFTDGVRTARGSIGGFLPRRGRMPAAPHSS